MLNVDGYWLKLTLDYKKQNKSDKNQSSVEFMSPNLDYMSSKREERKDLKVDRWLSFRTPKRSD